LGHAVAEEEHEVTLTVAVTGARLVQCHRHPFSIYVKRLFVMGNVSVRFLTVCSGELSWYRIKQDAAVTFTRSSAIYIMSIPDVSSCQDVSWSSKWFLYANITLSL